MNSFKINRFMLNLLNFGTHSKEFRDAILVNKERKFLPNLVVILKKLSNCGKIYSPKSVTKKILPSDWTDCVM